MGQIARITEAAIGFLGRFRKASAEHEADAVRRKHHEWVRTHVQRIVARWKSAPPVHVLENSQSFPVPAPPGARGLYYQGEAFVSAMQWPQTLAGTLAHEVVAHHGVRQLLRSRWRRFMDGLHAGLHDRPARRLARARDFVKRVYRDRRGRLELSPIQLADEVAAAEVERCTDSWSAEFLPPRSRTRATFANVMRELRKPRTAKLRFGYSHLVAVLKASSKKLKEGCSRFSRKLRSRPGPSGIKRPWRSRSPRNAA